MGRHRLVQLHQRRPPTVGVRDWRAGDGEFRRQQRVYRGVGLEERHRRSRQERLHEERRDSADSARILRADRDAARHDDRAAATARERLRRLDSRESLLARQIERASQAERQAQRRAAEVRARLLAERRAAGEVPGAAPAIITGDAPSESGPF